VLDQLTIAVIDDDASVRRALGRLLHAHGARAELFSNGTCFLTRLEGDEFFRPDCAVLDIHMPDMSGLDVQEALQRLSRRIPVVFITALGEAALRARATAAGAATVLQKPLKHDALIRAIQDARGGGLHQSAIEHLPDAS